MVGLCGRFVRRAGRRGSTAGKMPAATIMKQLLRPEALEVFVEWKTKMDKIRY